MKHRSGLTILEVLIATAILAALAAACIPLVRSASAVLRAPPPTVDLTDVVELADAVLAHPAAHGINGVLDSPLESFQGPHEIAWPEHPDRPAVSLHLLVANDQINGLSEQNDASNSVLQGLWLVFSCEPWQVFRWLAIETSEASVAAGGEAK